MIKSVQDKIMGSYTDMGNTETLWETNIKKTTENQMRKALIAIVHEIQRYHTESPTISYNSKEEIFIDLIKFKSNLKLKRKQVKNLRINLNIACIVAKTLLTAKENDTVAFNKQIHLVGSHCNNLLQNNKMNETIIEKFKSQNRILTQKMYNIGHLINLGYIDMQKMQDSRVDELTTTEQLKELFVTCGHYYAKYYNEHEKRLRLERKNRFLSNKINIMESSIEAINKELIALRHQNVRLQKENNYMRKMRSCFPSNIDCNIINSLSSIYFWRQYKNENVKKDSDKFKNEQSIISKSRNIDFTSHLSLVEMLICDQDSMLRDLNKLSEEIKKSTDQPIRD
ncbi:uncharacterized protein LOC131853285 [Achroia grisella]|uniref:uncharacterized protein LOC131853285 n=1 Tax=Achroia grisella TaxID=688607 RepID=UPI0027D2E49C|nr:uncharacterized protein LOC131853285 [Achroia grisella]